MLMQDLREIEAVITTLKKLQRKQGDQSRLYGVSRVKRKGGKG